MNKEWRNELFESNSGKTQLNSLGFPLSRSKAMRILDIVYRTWLRWEKVAMTIPEYKLQHTQLKNRTEIYGGKPPVTPYQTWVIGKIGEIYTELPDGVRVEWMAKEYIEAQKDQFTRKAYEEEQSRYTSMALTA